jgi:hypothetical protein
VNVPRFRIASIMVVVAIVALNLVAIRVLLGFRSLMGELLILGALPMANVLAVGLVIGQRRPGNRPFLLGFVPFGAMALAVYVATATSFPREIVVSCLTPVNDYLESIIGPHRPLLFIPAQTFVYVLMLGLPQLVFGLIGGILSRTFITTISISKRQNRTPA